MDAFEQVVAEILWREGYWVRTSAKVELTKEEKREIELPSSPRWELDVVAYSAKDNHLKVIECKSHLDSPGIRISGFNADHVEFGAVQGASWPASCASPFSGGCANS